METRHYNQFDKSPFGSLTDSNDLSPNLQLEAAREAVVFELETAKKLIEAEIKAIERQQVDGELSETIEGLKQRLDFLEAQLTAAQNGSIGALIGLSRNLPAITGSAINATTHATSVAALESAHLIYEMTDHQVSTLHAQHDRETGLFQSYERRSSVRIEALARNNGLDVSGWRMARDRLIKERNEAKANGDRLGYFKSDALVAANNHFGLVKSGATSEEAERARKEAEDARMRYLKEVELQARQEARSAGMSPEQATQYIAKSRTRAEQELGEEEDKLAAEIGIQANQLSNATVASVGLIHLEKENSNQRHASPSIDTARQTIKGPHLQSDLSSFSTAPSASADPLANAQEQALTVARQAPAMLPDSDPDKSQDGTSPSPVGTKHPHSVGRSAP